MNGKPWTLDPASELGILVRWEINERDLRVRFLVREYVSRLVIDPVGRGREEVPGVFSAQVPRTDVWIVWTLEHQERLVVLALVGRG